MIFIDLHPNFRPMKPQMKKLKQSTQFGMSAENTWRGSLIIGKCHIEKFIFILIGSSAKEGNFRIKFYAIEISKVNK